MNTALKSSEVDSILLNLTKLDEDIDDDIDFQFFAKDLFKFIQAEERRGLRKEEKKKLKSLSCLLNTISSEEGMTFCRASEGQSQLEILQRASIMFDHLIKVNKDLKRKRIFLKKKLDERKMNRR